VKEKEKITDILPVKNKLNLFEQIFSFFKIRKYIHSNNIDTIIINTTEIKIIRNLFSFLPKHLNYVGLVHNAKKLESGVTIKKILSKKMQKYFVLGDFLLKQIKPFPGITVKAFYPIYFPKPKHIFLEKPKNDYWVVIPGKAEQSRRDYSGLITEIRKSNFNKNIKFFFLGEFNLNDVIDDTTENHKWWKDQIVTFKNRIDYDTFHNYIIASDIILPLLKIDNDDMYAHSRISGSFNLAIGYNKPLLLPFTYKENTDLNSISIYYNDYKELAEILNKLLNTKMNDDANGLLNKVVNVEFEQNEMSNQICKFIFS
jgi:hypothetical protein